MSAGGLRETLVVRSWAVLDALPRRGARRRAAPLRAGLVRAGSEVLLTALAVAGLAVAGLTLFASQAGVRPLVVRSGSMEPYIRTGSMVLVQRVDAASLRVGDVVTVPAPDGGRVTHRVAALAPARSGAVRLTTKGDANRAPDPWPSTVTSAERVVWRAPGAGRAAAWLATAQGGFVLGCAATAVVFHLAGRDLRRRGWRPAS